MSRLPSIDLADAHVVVTGGARGIGRATVEAFLQRGARVTFGDLDAGAAARTAAETGASGRAMDVRDRSSFAALVDSGVAEHGPVDVLVNNAGVMPNGPFLDGDEATDRLILDVNVSGVLHGMRLVLPGMAERGRGHVVNVASLAGKFPVPGLAVYNASKYAVVGLTAATRLELAPHGVSLTAVLPSAVDTDLASGLDMKPIPKVSPAAIADAIVGSVASRAAEIAVPGYVGAIATASQVLPVPALDRIRRLVRDDRAMRPDTAERSAYSRRLRRASHERSTP